jgi:hypothetical protein
MLSLRGHALVTGGFFAAILLIGWGGNLVEAFGLIPDTPAVRLSVIALMLGLCAGLAFSAGPLMVLTVLRFQVAAGNANRPIIRCLLARHLVIAVPAAILGGAFDTIEFRP